MNADVHALAGAYALDALPDDEAAEFSRHLAECASCQQEVAELQVTAAQLGLAVMEAPPAELRDRVLRAARQTRQIPPLIPPTDLGARRSARQARWPQRLIAAAAAVVVVAVGFVAVRATIGEPTAPVAQPPVAEVMTADDAHTSRAELRGGGTLTVISSHRHDRAVVVSEDLPPLGDDLVYQLWLVDKKGAARSADVLIEPRQSGSTRLVHGVHEGDTLAITREPAGGSEQPTMTPLAALERV